MGSKDIMEQRIGSYLVYQLQTLRKKQAENKMEQTDRQTGRKERCLVVP